MFKSTEMSHKTGQTDQTFMLFWTTQKVESSNCSISSTSRWHNWSIQNAA